MTEAQLQARLLPGRLADGGNGHYVQPDFAAIHLELKRKGMTLMLLWQEHQADNPVQVVERWIMARLRNV